MPASLDDKLVVAISSRALFDLEEENRIFDAGDPEGMMKAWMPLGGADAFGKFQKMLWDSASAMSKKDGK